MEAQSYGPNSLVGIKVVEYVPLTDATGEETPSSMPAHSHVIQSVAPSQSHSKILFCHLKEQKLFRVIWSDIYDKSDLETKRIVIPR